MSNDTYSKLNQTLPLSKDFLSKEVFRGGESPNRKFDMQFTGPLTPFSPGQQNSTYIVQHQISNISAVDESTVI